MTPALQAGLDCARLWMHIATEPATEEEALVLDSETVVRSPHSADDPRTSVSTDHEGVALTMFFDREGAWTGEAPLLEIRLTPPAAGKFEPVRLMPALLLHERYARATLARNRGDILDALRMVRENSSPRRGLSDEHLRIVAEVYRALVAAGEPHPVKALAAMAPADKSTASRWISAARARGYLLDEEDGKP
jgi:hypothetical protein